MLTQRSCIYFSVTILGVVLFLSIKFISKRVHHYRSLKSPLSSLDHSITCKYTVDIKSTFLKTFQPPRNISRTRSLLLIGCVVSTEILCHIQGHFSILLSQWQLCQNNCCNGIQLLHFLRSSFLSWEHKLLC